jgi:hypothetical protein
VETIADRPWAEMTLPFVANDLRISPSGRYLAAIAEDENERTTVHIGPAGGTLASLPADDVIFTTDDQALIVQQAAGEPSVRLIRFDEGLRDEHPPVALTGLFGARVRLTPSLDRWIAVGSGADRMPRTMTARLGEAEAVQRTWPAGEKSIARILGASEDRVLLLETHYRLNPMMRRGAYQWAALVGAAARTDSQLSLVDARGTRTPVGKSSLNVSCDSSGDLSATICAAYDGSSTRLYAFDAAANTFRPLAISKGYFFIRHVSPDGWISGSGWAGAVAIPPRSAHAIRVRSERSVYAVAASDHAIAAATTTGMQSIVRIYTHADASARR